MNIKIFLGLISLFILNGCGTPSTNFTSRALPRPGQPNPFFISTRSTQDVEADILSLITKDEHSTSPLMKILSNPAQWRLYWKQIDRHWDRLQPRTRIRITDQFLAHCQSTVNDRSGFWDFRKTISASSPNGLWGALTRIVGTDLLPEEQRIKALSFIYLISIDAGQRLANENRLFPEWLADITSGEKHRVISGLSHFINKPEFGGNGEIPLKNLFSRVRETAAAAITVVDALSDKAVLALYKSHEFEKKSDDFIAVLESILRRPGLEESHEKIASVYLRKRPLLPDVLEKIAASKVINTANRRKAAKLALRANGHVLTPGLRAISEKGILPVKFELMISMEGLDDGKKTELLWQMMVDEQSSKRIGEIARYMLTNHPQALQNQSQPRRALCRWIIEFDMLNRDVIKALGNQTIDMLNYELKSSLEAVADLMSRSQHDESLQSRTEILNGFLNNDQATKAVQKRIKAQFGRKAKGIKARIKNLNSLKNKIEDPRMKSISESISSIKVFKSAAVLNLL